MTAGEREVELRSRAALDASVEHLSARVRSRLTQARHAALDELGRASRRKAGWRAAMPVAAFGAAAALAFGIWSWQPNGASLPTAPSAGSAAQFAGVTDEDLDFVLGEGLFEAALYADVSGSAGARTAGADPEG